MDAGGLNIPVNLVLCQTDTATAQCLTPPVSTVPVTYARNQTASFSVFATAIGPIPFNPATTRAFVRFIDANGGASRGSTSVAFRSP